VTRSAPPPRRAGIDAAAPGVAEEGGVAVEGEVAVGGRAGDRIKVIEVPGADHGLTTAKGSSLTARGVADLLVQATAAFALGGAGRRDGTPSTRVGRARRSGTLA